MRTSNKAVESGSYFITSSISSWIKLFNNTDYSDIIVKELKIRQSRKELKLIAFVIMPDHIHLVLHSDRIRDVVRNIKSYSAKSIIEKLKADKKTDLLNAFKENKLEYKKTSTYQVWQEGFHPKIIINPSELEQKINYIHFNPVRKGFVDLPEKWKYSSYNNYFGGDTIMDVDLFE